MSFVSGGHSFGAGVSVSFSRSGWAWALRAHRAGLAPAPACVYVPCSSFQSANAVARALSLAGWRCWVRPAVSFSPWRSGAVPAPAFAVKVALPSGVSARSARASIRQVANV